MISFDPGFKKMGVAILDSESGKYVDSMTIAVRSDKKMTQS